MDNNFDIRALETIEKISKEFGVNTIIGEELISPFSIGVEIEVKFKYMFPVIHGKYFFDFNKYLQNSYEEKDEIDAEIEISEEPIKTKLKKLVDCGVPKGADKYWEFAFNPVYDVSLLIAQVDLLRKIGVMPEGKHSLHITIGGMKMSSEIFWILTALELLYCDKERIESGFSKKYKMMSACWAKKGTGGIFIKQSHELEDCENAIELRTLYFNGDPLMLRKILETLIILHKDESKVSEIRNEVINLGLPDSNWGNPHSHPDIWNSYINNFNNLSLKTKKILLCQI